MNTLRIATYNIHKGFSLGNRRLAIHDLRERLRTLDADLVFLQEVHGENALHAARFENWPAAPQYEFLADTIWPTYAYGRNAVYDEGHHGNAILSRFPILGWENEDVSSHGYERRGLLHCELHPPRLAARPCIACACISACGGATAAARSRSCGGASSGWCRPRRRSSSRAISTTGAFASPISWLTR